jgi:hypothetical protein
VVADEKVEIILRSNLTISFPDSLGSWVLNAVAGGLFFKIVQLMAKSVFGILRGFDVFIFRIPAEHGIYSRKGRVWAFTTVGEMTDPTSPLPKLSPDEKFFVTIPPKGTKAMLDVTIFHGKRFWSFALVKLQKGYRIWISL